jgi:hypothetical protein
MFEQMEEVVAELLNRLLQGRVPEKGFERAKLV